jgi:hypothetical protein
MEYKFESVLTVYRLNNAVNTQRQKLVDERPEEAVQFLRLA